MTGPTEEPAPALPMVMTVLGEQLPEALGITDAHNHVWIDEVKGAAEVLPRLDEQQPILQELSDYRRAGGGAIVDCQPGGAGRNGLMLKDLARKSGLHLVACTGFHLPKYYPQGYGLFRASADEAHRLFVSELQRGLAETLAQPRPVRAGFIKIACQATLEATPQPLLDAALRASLETGALILAHTEKGSPAEALARYFLDGGLAPRRLVLCHMDKRPDRGLHETLAQAGIGLEYDTFFRAKYQPDQYLWPLLERMVSDGWAGQVMLATDMGDPSLWSRLGNGPGLTALPTQVKARLHRMGMDATTIEALLGGNVAQRLARPLQAEG
jgi:predicted metal-dependent phosphotriesterase family hydrolase